MEQQIAEPPGFKTKNKKKKNDASQSRFPPPYAAMATSQWVWFHLSLPEVKKQYLHSKTWGLMFRLVFDDVRQLAKLSTQYFSLSASKQCVRDTDFKVRRSIV